jgi:hypothetical protein
MAVHKFDEDFFFDMDAVRGVRWIDAEDNSFGLIFYDGEKVAIKEREMFDKVKAAFLWKHIDYYDGKEKIRGI